MWATGVGWRQETAGGGIGRGGGWRGEGGGGGGENRDYKEFFAGQRMRRFSELVDKVILGGVRFLRPFSLMSRKSVCGDTPIVVIGLRVGQVCVLTFCDLKD